MGDAPPLAGSMGHAWAQLRQNAPIGEVVASIASIAEGDPEFAQAQRLRAVCALRAGDAVGAKFLALDSVRRNINDTGSWLALAEITAALGAPDDLLAQLLWGLSKVPSKNLRPFLRDVLQALGFADTEFDDRKDAVFGKLLLPLLSVVLDRQDMDNAFNIENAAYSCYVKTREDEKHFARSMGQISELFTKSGKYWAAHLPPVPVVSLQKPYKVGFFLHNASMLAHVEVMLNTLKGYRALEDQPFEPTVYCFNGKFPPLQQALAEIGVRLVMLNELFPEAQGSTWQRLLKFRQLLADEGVQELVWVSLVVMLPLAFTIRFAPVQTWWAMKYRNFSHPAIDGYVTGSALTPFGEMYGRRWRMGLLGVDDWYAPAFEQRSATLRASLGEDKVVLMTLGRTEKMQDPAYLSAVAALLKACPQAVFLWTGRTESSTIVRAFEAAGVLHQTCFIGWVETRLYAQVADIFLDSFPFPCGFTLFQAMAAGCPVVIYTSSEAAQTGLWSFLKPLLDDGVGEPDEIEQLKAFVTGRGGPLISIARTPDEYVGLARRLIEERTSRVAAGQASRRFIARYFSDPKVMGRSFARHFVELIEDAEGGNSA
jgi:glycosyltransferase involved in cell wall biosynthesis